MEQSEEAENAISVLQRNTDSQNELNEMDVSNSPVLQSHAPGDYNDVDSDRPNANEVGEDGSKSHKRPGPSRLRYNPADVKPWVKVDAQGEATTIQTDKFQMTHTLGLQPRDLRLLDPLLTTKYPAAILDRNNAIIVNLEFIRCIITTEFVMVSNPEDELVLPFIKHLRTQLASATDPHACPVPTGTAFAYKTLGVKLPDQVLNKDIELSLPFELKALEVCLETVAGYFDAQATDLAKISYPALDGMAHQVSTDNLERVRRIKNRLVGLKTRVETVREVLDRFLDDDEDMHKLNLTAQKAAANARQMSLARPTSFGGMLGTPNPHAEDNEMLSSSSHSSEDEEEIQEVEMLLEAYFMNLDSTIHKLQNLDEYIKDTEDLVNIQLDSHRNKLIAVDLVLNAFTCAGMISVVISGTFTQNLHSGPVSPYSDWQDTTALFNTVSVTSTVGPMIIFIMFLAWCWRYKYIGG